MTDKDTTTTAAAARHTHILGEGYHPRFPAGREPNCTPVGSPIRFSVAGCMFVSVEVTLWDGSSYRYYARCCSVFNVDGQSYYEGLSNA